MITFRDLTPILKQKLVNDDKERIKDINTKKNYEILS